MKYFSVSDDTYLRIRQLFGKQLYRYREAIGLSQEDLGILVDTTSGYVGKVERGEVSIGLDNMTRFAEFFGVDFFVLANPKNPAPSFDKLPDAARKAINALRKQQQETKDKAGKIKAANKEEGVPGRAKQLVALVETGFFKKPRTAKDAFIKLNPDVPKKDLNKYGAEIGKITVTLSQGRFPKLLDKLDPNPGSTAVRFVEKKVDSGNEVTS